MHALDITAAYLFFQGFGILRAMIQIAPYFLYGTAWKEERTAEFVLAALQAGFRGIDTANQRKHYHEAGVAEGVAQFLTTSGLSRTDLFIQTKYTFARGQDHRKPYDDNADFATQVRQSFESSLAHFKTDYLDSLVLHGPYGAGISEPDLEVWGAMEKLAAEKRVRHLGVSNCAPQQLAFLFREATIKPAFLQNRCFASTGWDRRNREFCRENQIIYQGFSLLTANVREINRDEVTQIARKYSKTLPQIIFRFARDLGMLPLTGTTQIAHMQSDLAIDDFKLTADEIKIIENLSG